jgi:hypothetical protein
MLMGINEELWVSVTPSPSIRGSHYLGLVRDLVLVFISISPELKESLSLVLLGREASTALSIIVLPRDQKYKCGYFL